MIVTSLTLSDTRPLITIISPCLNRAGSIAEAIESVIQLDYPNLEHLVNKGEDSRRAFSIRSAV